MAQLCATDPRWLSAGQRGRAAVARGNLAPGTGFGYYRVWCNRLEGGAGACSAADAGIPSVYLSNRDSVLRRWRPRSCSGYCRRCWPRAGKYPAQRAGDVDVWPPDPLDIENLNQDEQAGTRWWEEFSEYRQMARSDADAAGVDDSPAYRRETRWRPAASGV